MKAFILGLVLAGGRSSRMGQEKAFVTLRGVPLLEHALQRLTPQVGCTAINANGDKDRFVSFGVPVVPDLPGLRDQGPLGGILAGLAYAQVIGASHIATIPCDAPFAPRDLVARLAASAQPEGVAIATGPQGLEPTFALWPVSGLARLEASARLGERSLRGAAAALGPVVSVAFSPTTAGENPFANINSPEDLADAEARIPLV